MKAPSSLQPYCEFRLLTVYARDALPYPPRQGASRESGCGNGLSRTSAEAGLEMMKKLESSGRRRESERPWLMRALPSLMADMVQRAFSSARAPGSSNGRSDTVSSLGSIRRPLERLRIWHLVCCRNEQYGTAPWSCPH